MQVLHPLRELGRPLFDMSQPMPYTRVQSAFDAFFPRQTLRAYWKSQYLDALTDEATDAIAARAADRPGPLTLVNPFRLGGAVHAVAPQDTAFAEAVAVHGLVRRDVVRSRARRDAIAWAATRREEMTKFGPAGVPQLHQAGRRAAASRGRQRVRPEPAQAGPDQGRL